MLDALCIGHAAWDTSVWVPEFPAENSKCEVDTLIECSGGPAANAARLLAQWGMRAGFAGVLGCDSAEKRIVESLTAAGVDLSAVQSREDAVTPVSVILVNEQTGSRTIINRRSPVSTRPTLRLRVPLDGEAVPRLLLFDGHELDASLQAMNYFPEAITVLDAGSLREGTRILAERVQYLVASERFARQFAQLPQLDSVDLWQNAIAAIYQRNGRPVVITLGERGLIYGTKDDWKHMPAFPATAVDTTGAGDIFHGAFAYGILNGFDWGKTLRLAAMAGAQSVKKRGSSTSIPAYGDVQAALLVAAEDR